MCVIVYQPRGKSILRSRLKNCFENNPDGAGYMFSRDTKLIIRKGYFSFKKLWQAYRRDLVQNPDSPFVLHFRFATHGKVNKTNCHPFQVGQVGIVHNGILSDMPPDTEVSDTAMFCKTVLAKLPSGWLYSRAQRVLLEAYSQKHHSKFVFMDQKGNVWIVNEQNGIWCDEIWYSNSSYADLTWKQYLKNYDWSAKEEPEDEELDMREPWAECHFCGGYYPQSHTQEKGSVHVCEDCMSGYEAQRPSNSPFLE